MKNKYYFITDNSVQWFAYFVRVDDLDTSRNLAFGGTYVAESVDQTDKTGSLVGEILKRPIVHSNHYFARANILRETYASYAISEEEFLEAKKLESEIPPAPPTVGENMANVLNEVFRADPVAFRCFLINYVPVNQALIDHPTYMVDYIGSPQDELYTLTVLSLLNNILAQSTKERLVIDWSEEPDISGAHKFQGIKVLKEWTPE